MKDDELEILRGKLEQLSGGRRDRLDQFVSFFEESGDAKGLDALLGRLRDEDPSRAVVLLHVILSGSYPGEQAFTQVSVIVEQLGWAAGFDWIADCAEERPTTVEFVRGGLAYDVSNTLVSPVLTGIQRVVWEVARRLHRRERPVHFFLVKKGVGPLLLSPQHTEGFLEKYESSGGLDLSNEGDFDVYDALGLRSVAGAQKKSPLRVRLRARAKAAYEFSTNYLLPPAFARRIAKWLKKARDRKRDRKEDAAMPGGAGKAGPASDGAKGGGKKTIAWFEDCDLLVAELFCSMRSDFYPAFLEIFRESTMLIHDVIPISHPQYCQDSVVGAHVGYLRTTGMFDRVVPVSRTTGEAYSAFMKAAYDTEPRVEPLLLPNFMEEELGDLPAPTPEPGIARVCCFSTMEPRKNHWRMIEACEKLWDAGAEFELVLIGGSGWKSEELLRRIEFLREKGRPILKNRRFLDDAEVAKVMRTCVCSIYCSEVEGYGLPIVESLALGVPVISSNLGSMAEIAEVTEGCTLVDPFSLDSICEALSRFVGDEALPRPKVSLEGLHSTPRYIEKLARFESE